MLRYTYLIQMQSWFAGEYYEYFAMRRLIWRIIFGLAISPLKWGLDSFLHCVQETSKVNGIASWRVLDCFLTFLGRGPDSYRGWVYQRSSSLLRNAWLPFFANSNEFDLQFKFLWDWIHFLVSLGNGPWSGLFKEIHPFYKARHNSLRSHFQQNIEFSRGTGFFPPHLRWKLRWIGKGQKGGLIKEALHCCAMHTLLLFAILK